MRRVLGNAFDDAMEAVDKKIGWHKLPVPLALLNLIGIRNRLRHENLYDTGVPEPKNGSPAFDKRYLTARTLDGTYNDLKQPMMGAMKWYGRQPITVETWPGPMNPSRRRSGESRIALMAGMIVTWLQKIEKFSMPSAAARSTVIAVDGVVVSIPIAMKITCLSGFCRATFSASSGE